ncbi:hypothetical protein ACH5RR_026646 [Cinchona calisaya]|uniref:Uncharacterized protein n=1 Tax=Cinchona calisaya TaxID=153742 RepID=A0ABD2Z365_9GENT
MCWKRAQQIYNKILYGIQPRVSPAPCGNVVKTKQAFIFGDINEKKRGQCGVVLKRNGEESTGLRLRLRVMTVKRKSWEGNVALSRWLTNAYMVLARQLRREMVELCKRRLGKRPSWLGKEKASR